MSSQLINMSPNKRQRGMHCANASAQTQIVRRVKRSEDRLGGELLEGIPNDFMLIEIAARLPWITWKAAAAVSLNWQRAFQGGMVYNARVVSQKTETFVVVRCNFAKDYGYTWVEKVTLSLFSLNQERWYKLPSIPSVPTGIPLNCELAFLDSSIYLLGGTSSGNLDIPGAEVLVLDLAVQPFEWRRCADMLIPRRFFHIGVMHGKIFVFGGSYDGEIYELSNEAYDPKVDAWSWIAPLIPSVSVDTVYTVGQVYSVGQQFVCRGWMPENSVGWMDATKSLVGMSDDTPSKNLGRKVVVKTDARGTGLVISKRGSESGVDADDQMDGLHNVIESQFIDEVGRLRGSPPGSTPAEHLASDIERHEAQRLVPFLWAYDPVEDEWRDFERESLGTNNVEWAELKNSGHFRLDSDRRAWPVGMRVWTMSF